MLRLILALALVLTSAVAFAGEPESLWDVEFGGYVGGAGSAGLGQDTGLTIGVNPKITYESPERHVLIFGEVTANAFDNDFSNNHGLHIDKFNLRMAGGYGSERIKYIFPLSFSITHDELTNEGFAGRVGWSGLYVKAIDQKEDDTHFKQKLESLTEIVNNWVSYNKSGNEYQNQPIPPGCNPEIDKTCLPTSTGRYNNSETSQTMALYSFLKYTIEKNGWGAEIQAEITQASIPPTAYSKIATKFKGYKRFAGFLKFFIEADETVIHDRDAGMGPWLSASQALIGVGGNLGRGY